MTDEQRETIIAMRGKGCSYTVIAEIMDLSINTVKSYCQRNGLGEQYVQGTRKTDKTVCPCCGKFLDVLARTKPRRFCSDRCRQRWWFTHPEQRKKSSLFHYTCANCGKGFSAYGNDHRKYCCHECYVSARFKHRRKAR